MLTYSEHDCGQLKYRFYVLHKAIRNVYFCLCTQLYDMATNDSMEKEFISLSQKKVKKKTLLMFFVSLPQIVYSGFNLWIPLQINLLLEFRDAMCIMLSYHVKKPLIEDAWLEMNCFFFENQ